MTDRTPRQAAERIIKRLTGAGYQALLAGGCVRDLLRGEEPEDYDIATGATPQQITQLYPRAQQVGAHFGVVIVREFGHSVEVATFRTDSDYADGRHPTEVTFTNAEQDALRRDFTINGMFYDTAAGQVIDYVGGRDDLRARLVRAIGDPARRFAEDHLRLIRAVRFAARLDFTIEPGTAAAVREFAPLIRRVSRERVRDELQRIVEHPSRAQGFRLLADSTLLEHLWEPAGWRADEIAWVEAALADLPQQADLAVCFAAILARYDATAVDAICRSLTFSNRERAHTLWLHAGVRRVLANLLPSLADLKRLMAGPRFADLPALVRAHLAASGHPLDLYHQLVARAEAVPPDEIAPPPLVGGDDLTALGLPPGPAFGRILDALYDRQLNNELTGRDAALEAARQCVAQERPRPT